ncbi:lycopene cyclase domain-containing protein [Halapricum sp. CBA1109]|uniref:lycopene cyclase domain-containing protein n=1 Tax=Halapricum sp. CBA1109 TaxID=2668068 RepID=UPI0012FB8C49|nr:lycopene cyclase domain-containing protein [Halapricum sp. CBA1109]MUV90028.1 lycopene cyclase domain-containing protein [Halapricum sp. CBA1109]
MPPFTYAQFHALFLVPPLFVLSAATLWGRRRSVISPLAVGIITVVALVYTTPWDNYLIIRGVWGYGEGAVTAVIWEAPIEEYAFILLQPLLGAMWLHLYSLTVERPPDDLVVTWRDRALGALAALPVLVVGLAMLTVDATFYMGAILAWGAPVLALQWAVGWKHLLARARLVAVGVVVPTLYLSVADRIAIENGIWFLSDRYTTGLTVAGLPIEEGAFFFITTLFVVQGLVLYPWVIERWR